MLSDGEPVIVSLSQISDATAQRVVDLLSGATYAIGGSLSKLENDLFVFTPSGVKTNKNR
ncbi:MAG: cell division protein SepF [Clostridia bacterium]|nr:cell division protein SepF [Clostridia bacterium]